MRILVTGGAGYIGSHTIVELLAAGHEIETVDNLSNSSAEVIRRVEKISGKAVPLHVFDLQNKVKLSSLFTSSQFDAIIHFAGLKAVGESSQNPLLYYRNNIDSTLSLLEVMEEYDVQKLVFSSSATVYGSAPIPYKESYPAGQDITNPYGKTKYVIEQILQDAAISNPKNSFSILRYFNPIGAHKSGLIGEQPNGTPNNLMPFIAQVAAGKRPKLIVFGNDYETPDGTAIRDYVHVTDLAKGHLAALNYITPGTSVFNLGSGKGTSVLELVQAFEEASGVSIPYEIGPRRAGDLPEYYADASKALRELHWETEETIETACEHTWRWQSDNSSEYKR